MLLLFSGVNVVIYDQMLLVECIVKGVGFDGFELVFVKCLCVVDGCILVISYVKVLKLVIEEGCVLWCVVVDWVQGCCVIFVGVLLVSDDCMFYWMCFYMICILCQWVLFFYFGKVQVQVL